ncbi:phosphate signaling complex PhoU family protein [Euzebya tangerina]|uniref:phosphate signaling complex PhoU family protein n=1 Tax=Euzebya tangerina TaxID=591198 RepID=UPI000E30EB15|nr:phosphate uptake regulator PhoU [Euzebya tangerina]
MDSDSAYDPLARLGDEEDDQASLRLGFQEALEDCDRALIQAGELVAGAIDPMTDAFLLGDAHTAAQLIAEDRKVDVACQQLEERCFLLIAQQSPVAGDLRHLVAVLKCVQDVYRSGDLLRHVGESLTWIHPPSLPEKLRETVRQLGTVSHDLFTRGLASWTTRDALAANELESDDDQVDLLQKVLLTDLYTGTQSVEESVSLALIARYYERIADHGVEIARQTAYVVTGQRPPAGSG